MASNQFEHRRWNDERWTEVWPKREALTAHMTRPLLDAADLQPGQAVLDVGAGGGPTSLAAARAVAPAGHVVGADISVVLTQLAGTRAAEAGVDNVRFVVADAQHDAIEGGPFDVAISQFGVMFFDEPVTAFANIAHHLHPGGRLAFVCWQAMADNPWFFAPVVAHLLSTPPPPAPGKHATGPFALADGDEVISILNDAGFIGVERQPYQHEIEVPENSVFDDAQLEFMGIGPDDLAEARAAADQRLAQFRIGGGDCRFPVAYQVFTARRA